MLRPLTNTGKARVQAYMNALQEAMDGTTEFGVDKVNAVCEEVAKAHPISEDLRQTYSAEQLARMAEPLVLNHHPFLVPDAP